MFYHFNKNFIYVRPMKVASVSILSLLKEHSGDFLVKNEKNGLIFCKESIYTELLNNHIRPQQIIDFLNDNCIFTKNFVFTSIRNPYSHAISSLYYESKALRQYLRRGQLLNILLNRPLHFIRMFIIIFLSQSTLGFRIYLKCLYKPYTKWIYLNNDNIINHYIRVENIEEDFELIRKKFNLKKIKIEKRNVNSKINHQNINLYDDYCKKFIEDEYKYFIEKFGYKFPY